MGSIRKNGAKWRAEIFKLGVRKSKSFKTKAEANVWIVDEERKLENYKNGIPEDMLFSALIEKYQEEVTVKKRGARSELLRLNRFLKHPITDLYIKDLTRRDFEDWRDQRLKEVSPPSVLRELNTIHAILKYAVNHNLIAKNPATGMEKPKDSKERTQRYSESDINKILEVAGYDENTAPDTQYKRVAIAMLFAIETAMRAGEIASLKWSNINLDNRIAHLPMTKNGHSRDVPLSSKAVQLINQLEKVKSDKSDLVFLITPETLSTLFRRLKNRAGLSYLHFHDTRREALSRLAKKVDVMTLAKISGHRDIKILLNTYYAPNMTDVASLLD
ncbi:tyrosine-type recombinase/integrase [Gallibacterium anatis]|uniref:Integrase n=1 Tax=Gallibacterium anatis TaxID=750 RepID=A0A0A2XP53_9PAST|nr:site-specific integrase [Gallibacterium anatis]KGQ34116.1 integrase [Gallibacterium anatis]